ncbi:MAG: flavodoxin domain-containing protein [Bacteroidales bacterium]
MKKIALIFWPEGGNAESVADKLYSRFNENEIEKVSVAKVTKELLNDSDFWIVGGSTVGSHVWEDADDSNRWHFFFKLLEGIEMPKKTVAFYGLGDQVLYPHHFVDGLGVFQVEFEKRNAKIVGNWPVKGYEFTDSDGMKDDVFFGLAIDEDSQPEFTDERIDKWLAIVKSEFGL